MSGAGKLQPSPAWTEARVALVVAHYWAGLSAAQSAGLVGGVSKNAVVSKRRRLGLLARVAPAAPRECRVAAPAVRRHDLDRRILRFLGPPPPQRVEPLPDMDAATPADAAPKTLMALACGDCVWPLGPAEEPGHYRTRFCGAPVAALGRYCAAHAVRARRCSP
jgi:GcrA cell cycle regulator